MVDFSPILLLIIYGLVDAVIIFLALVNISHLFRTGLATFGSFTVTLAFFLYFIIVLGLTWNIISEFNWQQPIIIWNSGWLSSNTALGL